MQVNVKEFLKETGITEPFYPGKRLVHTCRQPGEFKSHCVVLDWREPGKILIEVKAGLSGRDMEPKDLKYYPLSFQTPTYVEIELINDNKGDNKGKKDEEESGSAQGSGSSGGGGKQPLKKSLSDMKMMASGAFGSAIEGKIPALGNIVAMVVMGTKIAAQAYGKVLGALSHQIAHGKVGVTELLAKAGDFVTKYTPPSFMAPTGDEQKTYKYDREKNANIGFRPGMG
jgi:hypothetical protein